MIQKIKFIATISLLILIAGIYQNCPLLAADKKPKERLAVLDLEAKYGVDKGLAEALSVIVRDKLHSFGDFEVMSRSDIQAVASREAMKQTLGCDDDGSQCLVDFGRAIGTRFMVAGDISKLGETYTLSLRMLDTKGQSAGVKNRVSESCKCNEDALIVTIQDVAARLVGKQTDAAATHNAEDDIKKAAEEKQRLANEIEKLRKVKEKAEVAAKKDSVVPAAEGQVEQQRPELKSHVNTEELPSFINVFLEQRDRWKVRLRISSLAYGMRNGTIEFRSLNCGGTLRFEGKQDNGYLFLENLDYGNCVPGCKIWIDDRGTSYKEICKNRVTGSGHLFHTN